MMAALLPSNKFGRKSLLLTDEECVHSVNSQNRCPVPWTALIE